MRILAEHLSNVANTLRKRSREFDIATHGDVTGTAREALSSLFLKQHLPSAVSYLTGQLFDQNDMRSGQVDIIVHPIGAPKLNLIDNINLIFADSALTTIEVKSTLTTAKTGKPSHLQNALDSCVNTKTLSRSTIIRGVKKHGVVELRSTPVMIFAFDGPTVETLREKLWEYQTVNNLALEIMPDIITVLNRNYYLVQNNGWLIDPVADPNVHWSNNMQREAVLLGMYAYLTQIIEAYTTQPQPTPFSAYLRDLAQDA